MNRTAWIVGGVVIALGIGSGARAYLQHRGRVAADSSQLEYRGETGKTALELLRQHATVQTTTDPRLGEFVTTINGRASGTGGKYWIYLVNGQPQTQTPDRYQTKSDETIDWRLE